MQALNDHISKDGFRLRGTAMSRVDGFSDIVFGFALTLIVVSLEVPHTYDELHTALLGFLPFFLCFVTLIGVWWDHFSFFRRYGLHDEGTIFINCTLLFTVLFYVYPLKFLFTVIATPSSGPTAPHVFSNALQIRELMILYGVGFAAIYLCLSALYWNAWRQRASLHLSSLERTLTLTYLWDHIGFVITGMLCCLAARLLPPAKAAHATWAIFFMAIWKTLHRYISRKHIRAARANLACEDSSPLSQPD
jgi:uncharacterized membrane protein